MLFFSFRFLFFISLFLFFSVSNVLGQPVRVASYLAKMDSNSAFHQASWGFCLLSGKNCQPLQQFNPQKSLVPASVVKLFTTSAAIALLGDTFRFKTQLLIDGKISQDGILNGHLIVKGGGDPVLGSLSGGGQMKEPLMRELVKEIRAAGIKKIKGNVLVDISYFENEPVPAYWIWYDIGNYYAPPLMALNLSENQYEIYFKPGLKAGDSTKILYTQPEIPGLKLINHTTTAIGGGDQTFIPGPPHALEKHIYGKMPVGDSFKIKGAIPRPELFFLQLFKNELKLQNIAFEETSQCYPPSKSINTNSCNTLYTHYSPMLSDICRYANYTSNNLTAECILRTLGAEILKNGSTAVGLEIVNKFVQSRMLNPAGFKMVDGSGLSKYNLVNATQLASYLGNIVQEPWFKKFYGTLPYSGKGGTLEKFCDGTPAEGRIVAKSGSMERIKCYAGYLRDAQDKLNPFAVLVNNHDVPNREVVKWIEGLMEACMQ
jgi:D-alanyl-D-alanine carboxypeptidase/D-alanyl-D-alanine-endopeptidase (penicillin-binding protein 4)